MVLIYLGENEISEIKKILEGLFSTNICNKRYFTYLLLKWFKIKGISFNSSQKIIDSFTHLDNEFDYTEIELRDIYDTRYDVNFGESTAIEEEIRKLLTEIDGDDTATRILSAIKSLLPQRKFINNLFDSSYLNNGTYGIMSYDGPIIAICDSKQTNSERILCNEGELWKRVSFSQSRRGFS